MLGTVLGAGEKNDVQNSLYNRMVATPAPPQECFP